MKDGQPKHKGDPEGRRAAGGRRGSGPVKQRSSVIERGFVERATARGHSGHGAESVRPHLRDQLRLKALLPTPFPLPETPTGPKDEPK
jgi:hypothetical protein